MEDEDLLPPRAGGATGTFAISGTVSSDLGEQDVEVTFIPRDSDKYDPVVKSDVKLTIAKRVAEGTSSVSITDKDYDTEFESLGLPYKVSIAASGNKTYADVPVTWDEGYYNKTSLAEQTIAGTLDLTSIAGEVEQSATPVAATATVKLNPIVVGSTRSPTRRPPTRAGPLTTQSTRGVA